MAEINSLNNKEMDAKTILEQEAKQAKELIENFEFIICPLCKGEIQYQRVNVVTHAWVCGECPFVGFEYYSDEDSSNIYDELAV